MTEISPSARPTVEARQQQILAAAARCARRSGFHGASMSDIAQAASMSVGQIYRYFENKEAIIAAIVDQDVQDMREKFAELETTGASLADAIIERADESLAWNYDPERAALRLEVFAEAARNPRVAAMLQASDAEERAFRRDVLKRTGLADASDAELDARGEVLNMVFEGMLIRSVNNPGSDQAAIAEVLRSTLRHLLVNPS
jgi:AcrR family transcriptional regulator